MDLIPRMIIFIRAEKGIIAVCLRRSQKVSDVSLVDMREIQRKLAKKPLSPFERWCSMIRQSLKKLGWMRQKTDIHLHHR